MGYRTFTEDPSKIRGILLKGDPTVPPTRWWNHLYLLLRVWKEVTILEVVDPRGARRPRVGFLPFNGKAKALEKPVTTRRFAVLHGREDCTFFGLDPWTGLEVPLRVVARTTRDKIPPDVELV